MDNTNKVDSTVNNSDQNTTDTEAKIISQPSSNESKPIPKTIDIDGQRPIAKSDFQDHDILAVDGKRPIDKSDLEVTDTLDIDGQRPIVKSNFEVQDTLDVDGSRPITSNNTEKSEITTDYVD